MKEKNKKCIIVGTVICLIAFCCNPGIVIWALIFIGGIWASDISEVSSKKDSKIFEEKSITCGIKNNTFGHRGTSYKSGDVIYYSNENASIGTGKVNYFDSGIRSVELGKVTYYFDNCNREIGRSVDNGNGVHTYFDSNNNEVGHSYASGRITDFIGDCFEFQ